MRSAEQILREEDNVDVLRGLAVWALNKCDSLQKEVVRLREIEAQKKQMLLDMEQQRTVLRKLIFGKKSEKGQRDPDRERRTKEDETLLLHSQSLAPPPAEESKEALPGETLVYEMTDEQLVAEAKRRGLPSQKANDWEEVQGLYEESTEATVIERQYKLTRHKRKKYRYKPSQGSEEKEIIVTANGPDKLLPGCHYSIDFALSVVRDKYEYHTPLERQTRQMEALGLKGVGTKTLYNLCAAAATHLEPVLEEIRRDIFGANLAVHCDETPWPIFGTDDDGYLWTISNQAGSYYRFEPTRSGKVAHELLKGYAGPVLTDGYSGYERLKKLKGILRAQCWSHARRKFYDIRELYPRETEEILKMIEELFSIEHEAQDYAELKRLRRSRAGPLIERIYEWLFQKKQVHLRESELTKAIDYALKRWKGLTAFLKDVRIPLTNNDAERAIRHAVMGRKNFYGSKTINGADVTAVLYSVIESCKRVELDPTTFVKDAILRNNRGESPISPLKYAQELRGSCKNQA